MANPPIDLPLAAQGTSPTTAEGFIADRQHFWTSFTRFATYAAMVVAVLLILLAITLV